MKVLINKCYGGFSLSTEAYEYLIEKKGWSVGPFNEKDVDIFYDDSSSRIDRIFSNYSYNDYKIPEVEFRSHPDVIEAFEALETKRFSGGCAQIELIEIPDDVDFIIQEYDGIEWIAENHRTWG